MSRIGKKLIAIPDKVKVALNNGLLNVEGPLGKEKVAINALCLLDIKDKQIEVKRKDDSEAARCIHGMMRTMVNNAVEGVSKGFKKDLEINGVGYRAEAKGATLKLTLGFSHQIDFPLPEGIKVAVTDQTKLSISGHDKEMVGRVAAKIRSFRPPEPYKGKGIKYTGEHIIRKVGKAAGGK